MGVMRGHPARVYIIGYETNAQVPQGPVKIGVSDNPGSRAANLQTGNPNRLKVYWERAVSRRQWAIDTEKHLLTFFADKRLVGEWIDVAPHRACMEAGLFLSGREAGTA